jgi:hypothetical protein
MYFSHFLSGSDILSSGSRFNFLLMLYPIRILIGILIHCLSLPLASCLARKVKRLPICDGEKGVSSFTINSSRISTSLQYKLTYFISVLSIRIQTKEKKKFTVEKIFLSYFIKNATDFFYEDLKATGTVASLFRGLSVLLRPDQEPQLIFDVFDLKFPSAQV